MREYLGRLPDYTCRITIERLQRRSASAAFELNDRLRLEVAYSQGREFYAWPADDRFENGIEDLLPARGLVSNGSYALHVRKLFLTNDAEFAEPKRVDCGGVPCLEAGFHVPSVRSGYSLSAAGDSAPVPLNGTAWFDVESLDILRLEVRIDAPPRSVRVAGTREVVSYAKTRIGDVETVLPAESELLLRDRDGSQLMNRSRFDEYHRYAGSSTVRYAANAPVGESPARAPQAIPVKRGSRVIATLNSAIPPDAAVGDVIQAGSAAGPAAVRITDLRRLREGRRPQWSVELTLVKVDGARVRATIRRVLELPVAAGTSFTFRVE